MSDSPPHPLDPYSPEELTAAVATLTASGNVSEAVRYSCALPVEPEKSFVRDYTPRANLRPGRYGCWATTSSAQEASTPWFP